ncbi:MAG: Rpn family recombination-promoting nuclease/putative transposase, partial [Saprospiraceae bacterium]
MEIPFDLARHRPHDMYFEQVFKVLPVALELVKKFLPPEQLAVLNLQTLQLSSESFLSEDLREFFSDLVYTCETNDSDPVRICLLLEHKSSSTGRRIYVQLGNYLRGVQDEDIVQQRPCFTLTIPILFYHGSAPWDPGPLREQYGAVPAALSGYVPHFDFLKINVQAMLDEQIRDMKDAVLLRNVLLVFKHGRENEFVRRYFREVLIFVHENLADEVLMVLFEATLLYLQIVSSLNKHEIMELAETLPQPLEQKVKHTYEYFLEEGFEKGMEKGME